MARSMTTKNLFEKKGGKPIQFYNEILKMVIGAATLMGCWLIYGAEKNGKTWLALWLAKQLACFERVHYISAEEGLGDSFKEAVRRAGITTADDILWDEYLPMEEIIKKFKRQRSANIIIIDNLTMYSDEMKPSELKTKLLNELSNKLVIFISHEERNQPYPAIARHAKKLANVILHIQGLKAFVTSRFSAGGELVIDEEKSEIYWGETK
jgi:predicted ATP-dependent serine protease